MATPDALRAALQTLIDNGNRIPDGTTAARIGEHWARYLEEVSDHDLQEAIHRVVLTRYANSWPTIGSVLNQLPRNQNLKRLAALDDADEIFGQVLELVGKRGHMRPPQAHEYDDDAARSRAIAAGVRAAGGWKALCMQTEFTQAANRAAFRAAYKSNREKSEILGDWNPSRVLENLGSNGEPVSIAGILEHMEIGR